jgi:spoIIIJ-associated protein
MSEPPREFFTGTSLEQAVLLAAQHYGVEPDDLAYERVERRYGFLRQRRNVVIKVDPKRPVRKYRVGDEQPVIVEPEIDETPQLETQKDFNLHRDPPPPSLAHRTQRPPAQRQPGQRDGGQRGPGGRGQRGPGGQRGQGGQRDSRDQRPPRPMSPGGGGGGEHREARGEERGGQRRRRRRRGGARQGGERRPMEAVAMDFVPERRNLPQAEGATAELAASTARQLVALGGLELEIEVLQGETELEVELSGNDQGLLFENDGRLLLAIQHLLPRSMLPASGGGAGVRVDSQGFRSQRVASLERLAREAAEEVRRRGRPKTLQSMNPSDRRIVHLTLKDAEGVVTESNGDGFFKRITVRPA